MRLTDHFTLEEMTFSDYALRHGLENNPTQASIENLERLCKELLEPARAALGNKPIIVDSGYRSFEVNKGVGGAELSQHRWGCAADIRVHGMKPREIMEVIARAGLKWDQMIDEWDQWLHISINEDKLKAPRMQTLERRVDGYKKVSIT